MLAHDESQKERKTHKLQQIRNYVPQRLLLRQTFTRGTEYQCMVITTVLTTFCHD
jgi:hypothetical protein